MSQLSFVLYLTDDFDGGETTFYIPAGGEYYRKFSSPAICGSALCFFHGPHPLSPLHEVSSQLHQHAPHTDCVVVCDSGISRAQRHQIYHSF